MDRNALKPAEQLVYPGLSKIIKPKLDSMQISKVTPNMVLAAALQSSFGQNYFNCKGCGNADAAVRRCSVVMDVPEARVREVFADKKQADDYPMVRFAVHEGLFNMDPFVPVRVTDRELYKIMFGCRVGVWQAPMLHYLQRFADEAVYEKFQEFKHDVSMQCTYAVLQMVRFKTTLRDDQLNIMFSRFRENDQNARVDGWGVAAAHTYGRLVRATGER